jgi:hypothetical protein
VSSKSVFQEVAGDALESAVASRAEEYRARARSVRLLGETITSPEERQTLLDIAESYERLAHRAECASHR